MNPISDYAKSYFAHMHKQEGHRWIRSYETKTGRRYGLWEYHDGKRKRVGTATDIATAYRWMGCDEKAIAFAVAQEEAA